MSALSAPWLHPPSTATRVQVQEGDDVWHPDVLLTDVASELNKEKEKGEVPEEAMPPLHEGL